MDIKAELNGMRYLNVAIQEKNRELDELQDLKVAIASPVITGMPKGKCFERSARVDVILDKIIKLEKAREDDIEELVDKKLMRSEKFKSLPLEERMILEFRYFDGMTWADIAKKLNYEERTVYRIHGKALLNLKKL